MEAMAQTVLWAHSEFAGAELGDRRRTARLVKTAAAVASQVGAAISSACGRAGALAVSRLFRREESTLQAIVKPHIERTGGRCMGHDRVLVVQDTTSLDYTWHKSARGLGPITTDEKTRGLLMHSVMAFNRDKTPLGLLGIQVWARDDRARGSRKDRHNRPISEKESKKWLVGLCEAQAKTREDQGLLVIGDRESDVYGLLVAPRRSNVDLLVRVAHDRALAGDDEELGYIHDALERAPTAGEYEVRVPRQGSRAERTATLEVRITRVHLKAPRHSVDKDSPKEVEVSLVWAREIGEPEEGAALDWTLLCTERIDSLSSAVEMIQAYTTRWGIEEFHRVLKSGCRVEQVQFDSVEAIQPAIGLLAVVAWRVLYLTKYARSCPDADASEVATEDEIAVLKGWLGATGSKASVRSVREFVRAVAILGGFLGRKSDGQPGTKTLWQGLRALEVLLIGYRLAARKKM